MRKKIFIIISFLLFATNLFAVDFPEERRNEKEPFPRPVDGAVSEVNPPAFVWLPVKGADYYRFEMIKSMRMEGQAYIIEKLTDNFFIWTEMFEPGDYTWTVEAFDAQGSSIAQRRAYALTIPVDAIEFPYPNIEYLIRDIQPHHPRLIFDKMKIDDYRSTLESTRRHGWQAVKRLADESLELDTLQPPWYGDITDYNTRRLEYRRYYHYMRPYIDEGLQSLSLAWLMTGEEKYLDKAKEILLVVAQWDPHGITSCNRIGFDEPGLSFARCLHRVYDWLSDDLSENERAMVRSHVIERARDTWNRVGLNRPFLQNPGSSHDGRLIGYLGEQALVLAGEAPDDEVQKWLRYSLTAYWTVFPHWGGSEGGWAEGIGYAAAYNIRATAWIESFVTTANLEMWRKPFFQKIRNYFLYCARPNDEFWAFGDGAERGPRLNPSRALILRTLMTHYAQRFNDPACQWWADQVPLDEGDISSPILPIVLPEETTSAAPVNLPNAALFQDIGWAALHSDLADLDNDVFFLFKSSPFGSVSHSHADQNSFYLSVGGRALAIPSGYYGPVYGMPHHAEWTRSTKANNSILVNGEGQAVRDFTATGSISKFINTEKMAYACGDAVPAYKGALTRFDRHVLFIRPGFFVILDDLDAPEPSTFQWMLHALEEMSIDVTNQKIDISRHGAHAQIHLFNSGKPFDLSQTDQFDTPYNAGAESQYHTDVDKHWHLTAASIKQQQNKRIAAFMNVGIGNLPQIQFEQKNGWQKASTKMQNGAAEIWIQLDASADLPVELTTQFPNIEKDALVIGIWQPDEGEAEILTNAD